MHIAASPETANLARAFALSEWKKALPHTLEAMGDSERILVAGYAEWIMGTSGNRSDMGYYFVTTQGLRFGVKEKSGLLSKTYRDEFVSRAAIAGVRPDYMRAMDVVGHDGNALAVMVFASSGFQHAGDEGARRAAVEQMSNVAAALGHPI